MNMIAKRREAPNGCMGCCRDSKRLKGNLRTTNSNLADRLSNIRLRRIYGSIIAKLFFMG
jgi:hypothetical protein